MITQKRRIRENTDKRSKLNAGPDRKKKEVDRKARRETVIRKQETKRGGGQKRPNSHVHDHPSQTQ